MKQLLDRIEEAKKFSFWLSCGCFLGFPIYLNRDFRQVVRRISASVYYLTHSFVTLSKQYVHGVLRHLYSSSVHSMQMFCDRRNFVCWGEECNQ